MYNSALNKKPEGCRMSQIAGRNITHKVVEFADGRLKIISAGGNRQGGWPVFDGTYSQCEYYEKSHRR